MSSGTTIVPRWEWRTFGDSFGSAEAQLTAWHREGDSEGDEQYLLTAQGDNVKIRDELLDIKVLREVDDDGLERWEPILKASFPLDAKTLATVFESLRRPVPALARQAYSQDELLGELIATADAVQVLHVHKHRVRHRLGDCMGELTDLSVDGTPIRTLALESENPAAVVEQLALLGLEGRANTSVPRALLALR